VHQTDKFGNTALHLASYNNHPAVVAVLLNHDASVDGPLNYQGYGRTPLQYASEEGHTEVMRHLLAGGASRDIAASRHEGTPLELAAGSGHAAAAELLNQWPAELTSIMNAVVMRNDAELQRLLHSGGNPHVTVQYQQQPLHALTIATMGIDHENPHVTVQHQQQTLTALVLATIDENTTCWAAPVCTETLNLIQSSLRWTPEAHQLFPPCFRRGVKHVLGVKVALDAADRGFPQPIWMLIISFLPRDWETMNARRERGCIMV